MAIEQENQLGNNGDLEGVSDELEEEFVGSEEPEGDVFGRADEIFEERYRRVFGQPEDDEEELGKEELTEVEIPSRRRFLKWAAAALGWTVVLLEIVNNWGEIKRLVEKETPPPTGEKPPELPEDQPITMDLAEARERFRLDVANDTPFEIYLNREGIERASSLASRIALPTGENAKHWKEGIPPGYELSIWFFGLPISKTHVELRYMIALLNNQVPAGESLNIGPSFLSKPVPLSIKPESSSERELIRISSSASAWLLNLLALGPSITKPGSPWRESRVYWEDDPPPENPAEYQRYLVFFDGARQAAELLKATPSYQALYLSFPPGY